MAKVLGSLVGALVAKSGFAGVAPSNKDNKEKLLVRDQAALTTANSIADTVSLGLFRSGAVLNPNSLRLWNDALGAGVTCTVGDATHPAALGTGISLATAAAAVNLWTTFTAAKMGQPLWQALGYASDPGGMIELLLTIAGANVGSNGNLAWQLNGIEGV